MTVQEIMERAGTSNSTLAIAWIKDAINILQSNTKERIKTRKYDIINSVDSDDNIYSLPPDMIALESLSVLDTSDDQYKRIRRINKQPSYLIEDKSP